VQVTLGACHGWITTVTSTLRRVPRTKVIKFILKLIRQGEEMSSSSRARGSRNRGTRGGRGGRRQMELIASVSRSSGLEKDGDA